MAARLFRALFTSTLLGLFSTGALLGVFAIAACGPSSQAGGGQGQMSRLKDKAERAKAGVMQRKQAGEDVSPMLDLMRQVKPNVDKGNIREAESLLDQVLVMLGDGGRVGAPTSPGTASPGTSSGDRDRLLAEAGTKRAAAPYPRVLIKNENARLGYFDPSVEYGDGPEGWMAYSAVLGGFGVETHMARSDDRGATWTYVQTINNGYDGTITDFDGSRIDGIWRDEVATLVYDPKDRGREWKLYTHHYFTSKKKRLPQYGWITYQSASRPDGRWTDPVPLFGAGEFPPAPYDRDIRIRLHDLHPDLRRFAVFTEPGAALVGDTIFMSLSGLDTAKRGPKHHIVLIKSEDHGVSWDYVNILLTPEDAAPFGYRIFDGSSIVLDKGRVFLLVTPGGARLAHDGTFVIEFDDIHDGRLKRDSNNRILVHKYIEPDYSFVEKQGAGQSDYHEMNVAGGLVIPQFNWGAKPLLFQIYSTQERLVD